MKKTMTAIITIFSMALTPIYGYEYSTSTTLESSVEARWNFENNLPEILRQSLQNIVAVLLSTSPGNYCVFPLIGRSDLISDLIKTADVENPQANEILSEFTSKYPLCGKTREQEEMIQNTKQELENLVVSAKGQSNQFLEPYPLFENNPHKKITLMDTKKMTSNWLNNTFPFILNSTELFAIKDHNNKDSMSGSSINDTISGNGILRVTSGKKASPGSSSSQADHNTWSDIRKAGKAIGTAMLAVSLSMSSGCVGGASSEWFSHYGNGDDDYEYFTVSDFCSKESKTIICMRNKNQP